MIYDNNHPVQSFTAYVLEMRKIQSFAIVPYKQGLKCHDFSKICHQYLGYRMAPTGQLGQISRSSNFSNSLSFFADLLILHWFFVLLATLSVNHQHLFQLGFKCGNFLVAHVGPGEAQSAHWAQQVHALHYSSWGGPPSIKQNFVFLQFVNVGLFTYTV